MPVAKTKALTNFVIYREAGLRLFLHMQIVCFLMAWLILYQINRDFFFQKKQLQGKY